jgi:hypothetical protein
MASLNKCVGGVCGINQGKKMANVNQFGLQALPMQPQGVQGAQQYAFQQPKKKKSIGKKIKGFFKGTKPEFQQIPTQTPQGMQALQQLLESGLGGLQNPYEGFDPIAEEAIEEFHTQTVPSIAERFSSLGTGGSQRSSAFSQSLGNAGAGLSKGLAALKAQYGLQNRNALLSQLQLGLAPQFQTIHDPGKPGFFKNIGNYLAGNIGNATQAATGTFGTQLGNFAANKAFGG